ncbi:MAG: hypothetical protein PCFJNLEI_00863 [Verrucomicrobiae bacterium]|nr:hypothetical protein [Verrucomicrobiae bacterium]
MKLQLSTDFGSQHHWERLVAFAREHGVQRLVFWGNYAAAGFTSPFLFTKYPGWLTEAERAKREGVRRKMAAAAELTRQAGIEFGYCFQVLMVPDPKRGPREFFNEHGEPDMAGTAVYRLIEEQFDDLLTIAPKLAGVELWVMECASVIISNLQHQSISIAEIYRRIAETVFRKCRHHGLDMTVDLHTAGGHREALEGLLAAARANREIIVSADNVVGDFHLHLPFNLHLWRAAATNPVLVHFDLNGEYWGRNFYPTSALQQYAAHLREARQLGAVAVNGRISTGHDAGSPHFNVLPSRRHYYPTRQEVCCFDTLGGFNAEFFCAGEDADPAKVVRDFLRREFGEPVDELAQIFLEVEAVNARIFYAGQNYFNAQSILPVPYLATFWALEEQLTAAPGEPFVRPDNPRAGRAAFAGWPIVPGLRATGLRALISEKQEAVADAEKLASRAGVATAHLPPEQRDFIRRHFEDWVLYAKAAAALLEAMGRHFTGQPPKVNLPVLAAAWRQRQPHDEWRVAAVLMEWHSLITKAR